jgi:hypothetical protein
MKTALSPQAQADYRAEPTYRMNFSLQTCKVCRIRRSLAQYSKNSDVCDRCFKRIPKASK